MSKIAELRGKDAAALKDVVLSSKKELFNLRMQAAVGQASPGARSKELKKTVARAKTLLNEKPGSVKSAAPKKAAATKAAPKKKKD
jgi:large subunit ribosomal protein L29